MAITGNRCFTLYLYFAREPAVIGSLSFPGVLCPSNNPCQEMPEWL